METNEQPETAKTANATNKFKWFPLTIALIGAAFLVIVIFPLVMDAMKTEARKEAAKNGPIPTALQKSGTVEAGAIYARGEKFFVLAHEGVVLKPKELSVGWDYPLATGTVEMAFKEDAHADEPIRVEFENDVLQRDPVHPVLNTYYLVHLHNVREVTGAGWIQSESTSGSEKVAGAY